MEEWKLDLPWNMSVTYQLGRFMPSYPWDHGTCVNTRKLCYSQRMSPVSAAFAIIDSDEFAELPED